MIDGVGNEHYAKFVCPYFLSTLVTLKSLMNVQFVTNINNEYLLVLRLGWLSSLVGETRYDLPRSFC